MGLVLKEGKVLWYDAARGYGFVHGGEEKNAVFITKTVLDAFGVTGLHTDLEIVFDVVKGHASDRVKSIKMLRGARTLQ